MEEIRKILLEEKEKIRRGDQIQTAQPFRH